MKKFLCLLFSLGFVFSFASCKKEDVNKDTETTSLSETENAQKVAPTANEQGFLHFSHSFSEKWTTDDIRSTDVCLCAEYKESETSVASLILSVTKFNDGAGSAKAESLAHSVKNRESSSGEIIEKTIDGIAFYGVCFDSYEDNTKRLCNFFGQTEPNADGEYYFFEISIDNMSSDNLLKTIDKDLDTIRFSL